METSLSNKSLTFVYNSLVTSLLQLFHIPKYLRDFLKNIEENFQNREPLISTILSASCVHDVSNSVSTATWRKEMETHD